MQQEARSKQDFLNDLYWKWFLADMKSRLVQMICCLMEEQAYSKEEITASMMDLVAFIELEEKMADINNVKERYLENREIS